MGDMRAKRRCKTGVRESDRSGRGGTEVGLRSGRGEVNLGAIEFFTVLSIADYDGYAQLVRCHDWRPDFRVRVRLAT